MASGSSDSVGPRFWAYEKDQLGHSPSQLKLTPLAHKIQLDRFSLRDWELC